MKKTAITLCAIFNLSGSMIYAQVLGDPMPIADYVLTVKRQDLYGHGIIGHVHSSAQLEIKIGSTGRANIYAQDIIETKNFSFPSPVTLPGAPAVSKTFKINLPTPGLGSNYYPLPTVAGTETRIYATDSGMTYFPGNYGYGVIMKCTAPYQYTFEVTRLDCLTCSPLSTTTKIPGILSEDKQMLLYPNPGHGYAELEYTAVTNEKLSISITDINGRMISRYTTDLQKGNNRLPVDIRNAANGNYFVSWQSDSGDSGTLKMIKE